jgi:hypothetical protein
MPLSSFEYNASPDKKNDRRAAKSAVKRLGLGGAGRPD